MIPPWLNQAFFMGATEMWNLYFAPDHDDWEREITTGCGIQTSVGV
jgi:hypothetical protein